MFSPDNLTVGFKEKFPHICWILTVDIFRFVSLTFPRSMFVWLTGYQLLPVVLGGLVQLADN
jgi:hypothetical protein